MSLRGVLEHITILFGPWCHLWYLYRPTQTPAVHRRPWSLQQILLIYFIKRHNYVRITSEAFWSARNAAAASSSIDGAFLRWRTLRNFAQTEWRLNIAQDHRKFFTKRLHFMYMYCMNEGFVHAIHKIEATKALRCNGIMSA